MYKRILLKLSGEALKGNENYGIDVYEIRKIVEEIKEIKKLGTEIIIVVGAGNIWRGFDGQKKFGIDRVQADYIGMLGTIMNSLILQDALEQINIQTRVMTAFSVAKVAEPYIRRRALRHLDKGRIVILGAGLGSPYFSTDTAAALRVIELKADVFCMAKFGVEGVYDKDPRKFKNAVLLSKITHEELISKKSDIMDVTAVSLCWENNIDILVFNMSIKGNIKKSFLKEKIGTIITSKNKDK
ncbi:MAG: UMP kinase [Candidatus Phytoplasma pyri]|uniref:UMP kinase n=1 Tax=Candidatus Phytoplasma pyri TaxID=47566 RepID=UPI003983BD45